MFTKRYMKYLKCLILCFLVSSILLFIHILKSKHKINYVYNSNNQNSYNNNNLEIIPQQQQQPRFFICPYKLPDAARLGNILFAFGSLFGIAKKFQGRVLMPMRYSSQLKKIFQVNSFISDSFTSLKNIPEKLKVKRNINIHHNYADELCANVWKRVFLERWASRFDPLAFDFVSSKLSSMECPDINNDGNNNNRNNIGCDRKSNKISPKPPKKQARYKYIDEEPEIPIFGVGKYLQSFKYFDEHRAALLKGEFRFHNWIERRSQRMIDFAKKENFKSKKAEEITSVGIHVRRTDMGNPSQKLLGYTMASKRYIKTAVEFYSAQFKNRSLLFIVVTDDISWSRENVRSPNHPIVFSTDLINTQFNIYNNNDHNNNNNKNNNNDEPISKTKTDKEASEIKEESLNMKMFDVNTLAITFDLAMIATTDHCILTVGSYGWWGAFLNSSPNQQVVYYLDYPSPNSQIGDTFLASDYYPPNWVGLR